MKTKLITLIEINYNNPNFDVNKLAEIACISRSYLNEYFQIYIGCSAREYLEKFRLDIAKTRLLEGNSIIMVCKLTGYANKKTFYLAFKRLTNLTPKEFVKLNNS